MSEQKDFVVYNLPGMLSRKVTQRDPVDQERWIVDDGWYKSVIERMTVLFSFYIKHGLIREPQSLGTTATVVLRFSDFSSRGQRFIKFGASDRWLASFDRPGSKKDPHDVRYLEKQLKRIDEGARS